MPGRKGTVNKTPKEKLIAAIARWREQAMNDSRREDKCTLSGMAASARYNGIADAYLNVLLELENMAEE
jgi:hypothetical protein